MSYMARVAETLESHHLQVKSANSYSHARSSLHTVRARYSGTCTDVVMERKIVRKTLCVQA